PATLLLAAMSFFGALSYAWLPLLLLLIAIALYAYFRSRFGGTWRYIVNSWAMATLTLGAVLLVLFIFSEMESDLLPIFAIISQAVSFNKYIFPPWMQFHAFWGVVAGAAAVYWLQHVYNRIDRDKEPRKGLLIGLARWIVLFAVVLLLWFSFDAIELLRGTLS